jgi:enoyl-[acyl-carrier protein] reductase I
MPRRNVTTDAGNAAALCSDLQRHHREVMYVDGGFNTTALGTADV